MHKLLLVDDERSILEVLRAFLSKEGYEIRCASEPLEIRQALSEDVFSLVLTDLSMPQMGGLEVLQMAKEHAPDTLVIIMTAFATTESAIEAMKRGAYDYVMKPFKLEELRLVLRNALERADLARENKALKAAMTSYSPTTGIERLVGCSPAIQTIRDMISRAAAAKASVMIMGESGTGKELAAKAIHECSPRKDHPFVAINCAAIPDELLESELFGYLKGAFTGAAANKLGLFETAQGGTLFLDEIGELPMTLQSKLLRVLQEKTIRRLGASSDTPVDVRIVSATNRNLESEVSGHRFRQDLYFRLNVIEINMPPLRDRREDLPLLIEHLLERFGREQQKFLNLSPEARELLLHYDYPGNVRELENMLEQAVALETGAAIHASTLPARVHRRVTPLGQISSNGVGDGQVMDLERAIDNLEKQLLLQALRKTHGERKKAAELLGITFRSMRYRLMKHAISVEDQLGD